VQLSSSAPTHITAARRALPTPATFHNAETSTPLLSSPSPLPVIAKLTPQVRFIIVPDLLANAPMFKRVGPNAMRGRGIGAARGRATIQRANARRGAPRGQGVRR
jgi:hypothetical protein